MRVTERERKRDFSQLVFHAYLQLRSIMSAMLTERVNIEGSINRLTVGSSED